MLPESSAGGLSLSLTLALTLLLVQNKWKDRYSSRFGDVFFCCNNSHQTMTFVYHYTPTHHQTAETVSNYLVHIAELLVA